MNLTTLLAEHGGSIYFNATHVTVGDAVEAAVAATYPDAKIEATHAGEFHFVQAIHPDGAISSYMFAEELSA